MSSHLLFSAFITEVVVWARPLRHNNVIPVNFLKQEDLEGKTRRSGGEGGYLEESLEHRILCWACGKGWGAWTTNTLKQISLINGLRLPDF